MEKRRRKIKFKLNFIPRAIAILYIMFITLFAFDETILSLGFLIHLIPTFIFSGILAVAWFRQKVGGILFILAGIATIIAFDTYEMVLSFLTISLIPIAIGILFLLFKRNN